MRGFSGALLAGFLAFGFLALLLEPAFAQETVTINPAAPKPAPSNVSEDDKLLNRYGFAVQGENARVQIIVNGVPMMLKSMVNEEKHEITFNEWIFKGVNVINVRLERLDNLRPYNFNYQVFYQSPSQILSGAKLVLAQNTPEAALPLRQTIGIAVKTIPSMRIWQTEAIVMDDIEQSSLIEMINGQRKLLREAIDKGDNASLATYDLEVRNEVQHAYGHQPPTDAEIMKRRLELRDKLAKSLTAPLEISPEVRSNSIIFDVIAKNRLVQVTRNDNKPLIHIKRGDVEITLDRPIYGMVGGSWKWMR